MDVLWDDLKKFIPGEKKEEDENKKRVFNEEGPYPPAVPL